MVNKITQCVHIEWLNCSTSCVIVFLVLTRDTRIAEIGNRDNGTLCMKINDIDYYEHIHFAFQIDILYLKSNSLCKLLLMDPTAI